MKVPASRIRPQAQVARASSQVDRRIPPVPSSSDLHATKLRPARYAGRRRVAFRRTSSTRCRSRPPDRSPMSVAKWSGASLPAVSSLLRSIMSSVPSSNRRAGPPRSPAVLGNFWSFPPAPARRRCVVVLPAPRLRRSAAPATLASLQPTLTPAQHAAAVARIRDYIAAGDCYQVNFTFPVTGSCVGDPLVLYARLRAAQPVAHGGLIVTPDGYLLSFSPELFVVRAGGVVTARPMKGTASRGDDAAADVLAAAQLSRVGKGSRRKCNDRGSDP